MMPQITLLIAGAAPWLPQLDALSDDIRLLHQLAREGYGVRLADEGVALILADGDDADWQFWLATPKANAATRRIPLVCLSDNAARRAEALQSGADFAFSVAGFIAQAPRFIREHARYLSPDDRAALEQGCQQPLPPQAREAIVLFNQGEYYRQHDLLEALWMATDAPHRELYRAILQVGIAYYQITRKNYRGAYKMLLRSAGWLAQLPDVCQGVDVARLRADSACVRAELERLGAEGIARFNTSLLKPVYIIADDTAAEKP